MTSILPIDEITMTFILSTKTIVSMKRVATKSCAEKINRN